MFTFTLLKNRASDIVGAADTTTLLNIGQDINQGLRLFKNAARRYWTRTEKSADLVASQQYYQLPEDAVRASEVKVTLNGTTYPLEQISSENQWNNLNLYPQVTMGIPSCYFVRGRDEIGIWPIPSENAVAGLSVSYEPRMVDMSVSDVSTGTLTVTQGSSSVTNSGGNFTANMVGQWITVTDGTDGLWYKVQTYTSPTVIDLENHYQGASGAGKSYLIGQVPDIPEDYHLALVYYAAYNFFLKRKDMDTANNYLAMFNGLLEEYKATYASKTTGVVMTNGVPQFNRWRVPPSGLTG